MPKVSIREAVRAFAQGRFVILVDAEDRENEGDLAMAAEAVTPEAVAFMARRASGLICAPMEGEDLDRLALPMMVAPDRNSSPFGTGFTVSVEAREGVSTGISAHDRALTIEVLADPASRPDDLVQPGHVFPLRAQPGGVLARPGQTEASVDLARLAGLRPAAVICEIMEDDGTMARMPSLERFSKRHDVPIATIEDLIAYRRANGGEGARPEAGNGHPARFDRTQPIAFPTAFGTFRLLAYRDRAAPRLTPPHLALVAGELAGPEPVLTRIHSECLTGDVLASQRCDCGAQLDRSLEMIAGAGRGVIVYLRQEGRGIGLFDKIRAYRLQDRGLDTVEANHQLGYPADARSYGVAREILADLGVGSIRLLTNNPAKLADLSNGGVHVAERVPLETPPVRANRRYLETKKEKLGHQLRIDGRG
ncbi:MAG TPA: 3,4-dihydroxy-2-butanone-4-phosphate synthase [Thermoanaerobaculia bacterium]|nr:3,4-dihydroxy-2-butanone-4-phosphate synthase [Thermoanaerobaculia bacterium]